MLQFYKEVKKENQISAQPHLPISPDAARPPDGPRKGLNFEESPL